jgi:signal transduction histidine kinase
MSATTSVSTSTGRLPIGGAIGQFLLTPFTRQAWAELLYALISLPLALAGFVYLLATLYVSGLLLITLIGLPLLAAALLGARGLGALTRRAAAALLGLPVDAPPPFRPRAGLLGWIRSGLGDATGWRAMAYLLLKLPVGMLAFMVAIAFWAYSLAGITYAAWRPFLPGQYDTTGGWHRGAQFGEDYYVDTWPRILALFAAGVVLLVAAPWAVRGALVLDRLLIEWLLGPTQASARVRDLEESRAHAVDDSAARLRRIERDLHDGAQSRLVAVAMKLGMAKEKLDPDDPQADLEQARTLVDTAHRDAKEALVELRDLARGIHPPVLDTGLSSALRTLAARSTVPVELHVDLAERPSPAIETIAYFCAAELLTNVAKHSGARHATLELTQGSLLRLQVGDDGNGGARVGAAGGLAGLAERIRTVDGQLEIISPPGGPTLVTVELPHR